MKLLILFNAAFFIMPLCFSQKQYLVGKKITGDFDGNGKIDTATLTSKTSEKNHIQNWTIEFDNKNIPSIRIGCCEATLINEGDLNNNKTAELSVFQAPENGCVYIWTTFSLKNNHWTKIIKPFLVSTGCDEIKVKDLENKVFKEKDKVYYWDQDTNDIELKPIKKRVIIP